MKPLAEQDYYEALDVARTASGDEIERAYRLACATYREDSLAGYPVFEVGDVELLRERIEIAYRILVDPDTRRAYDQELAADPSPRVPSAGPAAGAPAAAPAAAARRAAEVLPPLEALDELEEGEGEWSGARLRRARLRQGMELDEISDVTKVNPTYLSFIEDERFDGLPAAVYVRGFVVGYADCLGLDAKRVAASYVRRYEEKRGSGRRRLFSRK